MRHYLVTGHGVYLGAYAVVIAKDIDEAERKARKYVREKEKGITNNGVWEIYEIQEVEPQDGVIFVWDGDY